MVGAIGTIVSFVANLVAIATFALSFFNWIGVLQISNVITTKKSVVSDTLVAFTILLSYSINRISKNYNSLNVITVIISLALTFLYCVVFAFVFDNTVSSLNDEQAKDIYSAIIPLSEGFYTIMLIVMPAYSYLFPEKFSPLGALLFFLNPKFYFAYIVVVMNILLIRFMYHLHEWPFGMVMPP